MWYSKPYVLEEKDLCNVNNYAFLCRAAWVKQFTQVTAVQGRQHSKNAYLVSVYHSLYFRTATR